MTSVTIPASVISIGNLAFTNCTGLTDVYAYPDPSAVTLGNNVFKNVPFETCTLHVKAEYLDAYKAADQWKDFGTIVGDLEDEPQDANITFADAAVKAICVAKWDTDGDGELSYAEAAAVANLGEVFKGNAEITSFDELEHFTGLTEIGKYSFYNCKGLTSIIIPNSVTSIGSYAFSECTGLTSVTIPSSVTIINNFAFYYCSKLSSVTIPNSVTEIGDMAFCECNDLMSLEIPNSVTTIGDQAFNGCTSLTSVYIPASVTTMKMNPFNNCPALTSITVDNDNTAYDSREGCNAIIETATGTLISGCMNTIIPNTVTAIGNAAFWECYGLTSVDIPNSVTSIAESSFAFCTALVSVTIPASVTEIGSYAFQGCYGLTDVYSYPNPSAITLSNDYFHGPIFYGAPVDECTLHVKAQYLDAYKVADQWKDFGTIVGDLEDEPQVDADVAVDAAPTSVVMTATVTAGEGVKIRKSYFEFQGEKYEKRLVAIRLNPDTDYAATFVVVTGDDETVVTNVPFHTATLEMTTQPVRLLTSTNALLIATTNIADKETSTGFQWRASGDAETILTLSCPTFNGTMAGTLKGLTENSNYDFRPFYKAADGTMYYGRWMTFLTTNPDEETKPTTYTYHAPAVTTTGATLEGVALQGTDEIDEQGFELWDAGDAAACRRAPSAGVRRFPAEGERMSVDITGLDYVTRYAFRTYVTAGGETVYGDIVTFTTDRPKTDVNLDNRVDVGDVNTVLADILKGANDFACDVNGDNAVDVGDVNTVLSEILNHKRMKRRYPVPSPVR